MEKVKVFVHPLGNRIVLAPDSVAFAKESTFTEEDFALTPVEGFYSPAFDRGMVEAQIVTRSIRPCVGRQTRILIRQQADRRAQQKSRNRVEICFQGALSIANVNCVVKRSPVKGCMVNRCILRPFGSAIGWATGSETVPVPCRRIG